MTLVNFLNPSPIIRRQFHFRSQHMKKLYSWDINKLLKYLFMAWTSVNKAKGDSRKSATGERDDRKVSAWTDSDLLT